MSDTKKVKKEKKEKKEKKKVKKEGDVPSTTIDLQDPPTSEPSSSPADKKAVKKEGGKRKREDGGQADRKKAKTPSMVQQNKKKGKKKKGGEEKDGEPKSEDQGGTAGQTASPKAKKEKQQAQRFTVFVGNLPYDINEAELRRIFRACGNGNVVGVRLRTDKETGKPKGFCFIDLKDRDSLQVALKLHHTTVRGRKINVELTAGGGGKGESRKNRLKEKNERLKKQRHASWLEAQKPASEKKGEEPQAPLDPNNVNMIPIGAKKD